MSETHTTIGVDGLVEFGQYLTTLRSSGHRHYSFEMPDSSSRLRECALEDVIQHLQDYIAKRKHTFRVCIYYSDYQSQTLSKIDRTFTRLTS